MNMKKWLAAAVACSGLMLAACGGQGNATADAGKDASAAASSPAAGKTYTVGLNAEFAPFESQGAGGEIEGFDVDILNAMAKAGGGPYWHTSGKT